MARALRIDKIETLANGYRHVVMTLGNSPLPVASAGFGLAKSPADWLDTLDDFDDLSKEEIWLFMLRVMFKLWKNANPTLSNPSLVVGKTCTLTVTATSITFAVA